MAFGNVLPDESVRVFIEGPFPQRRTARVVGPGKVDRYLQLPAHALVVGKLFAVVEGNGVYR